MKDGRLKKSLKMAANGVSVDLIRQVLKNLRSVGRVKCLGRGQTADWQFVFAKVIFDVREAGMIAGILANRDDIVDHGDSSYVSEKRGVGSARNTLHMPAYNKA